MTKTRKLVGNIVFWAAIVLTVIGFVSTIMSLFLFDGEERLWKTAERAGFTLVAWLVSLAARKGLLK